MESGLSKILGLPVREAPLRSTYLGNYERCPRLFLLQDRAGIHKIGYDKALDFGTLVHLFLQSMFMGEGEAVAKSKCKAAYQDTVNALRQRSVGGLLSGGASLRSVEAEADANLWKAIAASTLFWELNPFPVDQYEVLTTPIGEPLVEYRVEGGTIDLVLAKPGNPTEIWIVDHKTTTKDPLVRSAVLSISTQFQLYRRGLQELLDQWWPGKYRVTGVIANVIRTPGIKFCPAGTDKSEGFPGYLKRLRTWYQGETGPQLNQFPHRFPVEDPLTDQEVDHKIGHYKLASVLKPELPLFPRAGGYACEAFNKVCPLLPFCTSDPATWKSILRTGGYEVRFREDKEENQS